MKKAMILVMLVFFAGSMAYAVDGDLIVNGKVGVGTSTPTQKLDVAGKIRATEGIPIYNCVAPSEACGTASCKGISLNSTCTYGTQYSCTENGCECIAGDYTAACIFIGRLLAP